jgi:hypothetical protein
MNNDKRKAPLLNEKSPLKILLKEYAGEKDFFHNVLCACNNWVSLQIVHHKARLGE